MACRNPKFGRRTCELLSEYAQGMLRRRQEKREDVAHAEKFVKGLQIDYLPLDLGSIDSIFNFAVEAQRRYGIGPLRASTPFDIYSKIHVHHPSHAKCWIP